MLPALRAPETIWSEERRALLTEGPLARQGQPSRRPASDTWSKALTRIEAFFERRHWIDLILRNVAAPAVAGGLSTAGTQDQGPAAGSARSAGMPIGGRLVYGAIRLGGKDQQDDTYSRLTSPAREEQMRPPAQSYAYARPMRPVIEEELVIKRVQEKEVVEVVRKEIETVMKTRSPLDALSRSDYSRIADSVYSTLTRRLMLEKERMGRR